MCGTRQLTHASHCGRALPPRQRGCVCPTRPADPSAEFPEGAHVALRPRAGFCISGRRTAIPIAPHMQVIQDQPSPTLTSDACGDHHITILPFSPLPSMLKRVEFWNCPLTVCLMVVCSHTLIYHPLVGAIICPRTPHSGTHESSLPAIAAHPARPDVGHAHHTKFVFGRLM